jgi:tetratricopeptide (TPR) repeat protein
MKTAVFSLSITLIALPICAQDAETWYQRGLECFERGDYAGAMEAFSTAIRERPDYAEAYHKQGEIYYAVGDYGEAMERFNAAIRANPGYAEGYAGRGKLFRDNLDHDRAIADFTRAIALDPGHAGKDRVRELSRRIEGLRDVLDTYAHRNLQGTDNENYLRVTGELEAAEEDLNAPDRSILVITKEG